MEGFISIEKSSRHHIFISDDYHLKQIILSIIYNIIHLPPLQSELVVVGRGGLSVANIVPKCRRRSLLPLGTSGRRRGAVLSWGCLLVWRSIRDSVGHSIPVQQKLVAICEDLAVRRNAGTLVAVEQADVRRVRAEVWRSQ